MGNIIKKAFPVLNMHCAGCANNVEKTVKKLAGVVDASVNFATNTLSVSYEADKLTPGEIRAAVLAAGYDLIVEEALKEERQEEAQEKHYRLLKRQVIGAWIFVVPMLLFSMVLMHVPFSNEIQLILALPVMIFFGGSFYVNAWRQACLGGVIWIPWWHSVPPSPSCSASSTHFFPSSGITADLNLTFTMRRQ